jgi:uncharacterized protein (DUF3084 family)
LDDRPEVLRGRSFERLFRVAELAQLTTDEQFAYQQSQKRYWDMNNVIGTAEQRMAEKKDKIIKEKDEIIGEKDEIIKEQADALSEKDAALELARAEIANLKSFLKKK